MTSLRFKDPRGVSERAYAFADNVKESLRRRERLLELVGSSGHDKAQALSEALEVVNVQHAELAVAEEELLEQVDELARSLGCVQVERERYRELFEAAPDAYFVTDAHGVIREANERAAALIGVDARFVAGKPFTVYLSADALATFRSALLDTARDSLDLRADIVGRRTDRTAVHIRGRRLDGGRRILWIVREDEHDLPSEVGDLARALRDKGDLLERERRERERLEREARAKDRFLAILSHDLRSPLNAVLGWTDLLRREILDQTRRERALSTIDRNARALLSLVEELLDISRISAERMQLEVRPIDAGALVRRVVEASHPAARAKSIVLGCSVEDGAIVVADAKRIEQCLTNLLSNAMKFTPEGGQIDVAVHHSGGHVTITVKDSGKGISPEMQPHVFECFRQENDPGANKSGLGLGLYIVRQIALLHGGSAHVFSEGEGRGATFSIELPCGERAAAATDRHAALEAAGDLTGVRVLVVDDDEDTRELMTTLLGTAGAHVAAASDTKSALHMIESWSPDAIISDMSMQQSHDDGVTVVRAARDRLGDDVVVLALTGFASDRDAARSLSAGFDAHLTKPLSAGELIAALIRLREGRSGAPSPKSNASKADLTTQP